MRAVAATRYVTPLREGGSLPALVEADDDGLYVLKFFGAGQGPKALVAEVVAGELGRALGLPVPELVLVELDPAIGRAEPDPEIQDLLLASGGTNLGVDFLPGALPFSPAAGPPPDPGSCRGRRVARRARDERRSHAAEPEPPVVAPPALAHRPRRGALLASRARTALLPIHRHPSRQIADHVLLPYASSVADADARLAPLVTGELLERVVADVPAVWLDGEDRGMYVEYLARRLASPRRFAEEAERARG